MFALYAFAASPGSSRAISCPLNPRISDTSRELASPLLMMIREAQVVYRAIANGGELESLLEELLRATVRGEASFGGLVSGEDGGVADNIEFVSIAA
jgi:hypothetical protein